MYRIGEKLYHKPTDSTVVVVDKGVDGIHYTLQDEDGNLHKIGWLQMHNFKRMEK